jgi:hypothetical protein
VTEGRQRVVEDFDEAVNMIPKELEEWLETDESWSGRRTPAGSQPDTGPDAGSWRSNARKVRLHR